MRANAGMVAGRNAGPRPALACREAREPGRDWTVARGGARDIAAGVKVQDDAVRRSSRADPLAAYASVTDGLDPHGAGPKPLKRARRAEDATCPTCQRPIVAPRQTTHEHADRDPETARLPARHDVLSGRRDRGSCRGRRHRGPAA